jgi:hypothetical protein
MECRKVREFAEAYVSREVPVATAQAIAAHVDGCPACHAEIEGLRRLRASARSAYLAANELAPRPEFAAALGSRLRAEATPKTAVSPWRRTWLAVAATCVLIAGGGFGLRRLGLSEFTTILQAAVGDHQYCAVAYRLTERPIPLARAAQVYDDPVDRPLDTVQPAPAQLPGGPVRILERHSCVFEGRRFAHIVLQYKRELISLVVTPDDRWLRHVPGASSPAGGSIATLPPVDGYHVAAFRGPDHAVFVISTLDDNDLREVARSMAGPVSRALKASE